VLRSLFYRGLGRDLLLSLSYLLAVIFLEQEIHECELRTLSSTSFRLSLPNLSSIILTDLQGVGKQFNIYSKTSFETEVESATWSPSKTHWIVVVKDLKTKETSTHTARVLFSCVGALSIPRDLDIPGVSSFKGKLFHSAKWESGLDFTNKKVVVLGNGCSASQIIPGICKETKSLTQIVRSKHWYHPQHGNPLDGPVTKWLEKNSSTFVGFQRWILVLALESHFMQAFIKEGKGARERFIKRAVSLKVRRKESGFETADSFHLAFSLI